MSVAGRSGGGGGGGAAEETGPPKKQQQHVPPIFEGKEKAAAPSLDERVAEIPKTQTAPASKEVRIAAGDEGKAAAAATKAHGHAKAAAGSGAKGTEAAGPGA